MSNLALAVAGAVSAVGIAPHLVPLHKAAPPIGIAVWLLVLALRALSAIALATLALVNLAHTAPVEAVLAWCWHEVLPDLPTALGFDEHPVSHAAVAVPAVVLAGSVAWLGVRGLRGAVALHRLRGRVLGRGPWGSTVIHDERVVLAVTVFGRGRVLVSDRALGELDEDEIAAGLMHEQAHLRRLHRPVLVAAVLFAALARALPGTRAAELELRFQLERDADRYAVDRLRDPLALASAICKAATSAPSGAFASLGGRGHVKLRLEELLDGGVARSAAVERVGRALVAVLALALALLSASAPAWGIADLGRAAGEQGHRCEHSG